MKKSLGLLGIFVLAVSAEAAIAQQADANDSDLIETVLVLGTKQAYRGQFERLETPQMNLEIDEALLEHDAVLEAAAFARDCKDYGQRVEACVRLKDGKTISEDALRDFCKERIGTYKTPDYIYFLPDLPKGPSGKVQRLKLLDLVS